MTDALTPEGLKVCAKACDECLFTKRRIVSDERAAEVLEDCKRTGRYFICHKHSTAGSAAVCRRFFDAQTETTCQLAQRLGFVQFVPEPAE